MARQSPTPLPARVLSRRAKAGLALGCLVFFLILLEAGTRMCVVLFGFPPTNAWKFRRQRPPPYQDASYFSTEFLRESEAVGSIFHTPPGTRMVVPGDFAGTHINTRNGARLTLHRPDRPAHRIHFLGGSTAFCGEVPDEHTIATRLQILLNRSHPGIYTVENLGADSVVQAQELERLQTLDLRPADAVVFYDGVNDILQSIYYDNPVGRIIEDNRARLRKFPLIPRMQYEVFTRLRGVSEFVEINLNPFNYNVLPPYFGDDEAMGRLQTRLAGISRAQLAAAQSYCTGKGARFFHFLQPNIYTLPTTSSYEKELLENRYLVHAGVDIAFLRGNPALALVVSNASAAGVPSWNLSGVLDSRRAGEEFYLDFCHVNHHANQRIAEAIHERLAPALPVRK
jgi:hypothetical protein